MGRFRFIGDMWFDSHVHFDRFLERDELSLLLETTAAAGVHEMLAVGGSVEANERSRMLAAAHGERIVASAGFDRDVADEVYDAAAYLGVTCAMLLAEEAIQPSALASARTACSSAFSRGRTHAGSGADAASDAGIRLRLSLPARHNMACRLQQKYASGSGQP